MASRLYQGAMLVIVLLVPIGKAYSQTARLTQAPGTSPDESTLRSNCYSGKKYDLDLKSISSACKALIQLPGINKEALAEANNVLGLNAYNSGDYAGAIPYFDEAMRIIPNYRFAMQNKALTLIALKKCDDAFVLYEQSFKIYPDAGASAFGMSEALDCKGDFSQALKYLADAVVLSPQSDLYYKTRARHLLIAGEGKKALEEIDSAVRLNPLDQTLLTNAAMIAYVSGDIDAALKRLDDYNKKTPNETYSAVLRHLIKLGRKEPPGERMRQLYGLYPDKNSWGATLVGYFAGVVSEAQIRQAANVPGQAERELRLLDVHYYLGELKLLQGDRAGALQEFQGAVATNTKGFPEYWSALARVKQLDSKN